MSDNTLIEGMDGVNLDTKEEAPQQQAASTGGFIINSYGGYSKKGFAPYNPKKKNQDALIMAEDPKTRSLFLCVLDGHGEDGDKVAQAIKAKFANYLFKHRSFADDIKTAISDVVAKVESEILRGVYMLHCLYVFNLLFHLFIFGEGYPLYMFLDFPRIDQFFFGIVL